MAKQSTRSAWLALGALAASCTCLAIPQLGAQTPPAIAPASSLRIWQDASGQFTVAAQFLGLKDGKVELRKADGKVISIALEKLAAADQGIAKSMAGDSGNPFESYVVPGGSPTRATPQVPATTKSAPTIQSPMNSPALMLSIPQVADPTRVELCKYQGTRWIQLTGKAAWQGHVDAPQKGLPELSGRPIVVPLADGERPQSQAQLDQGNHHAWVNVEFAGLQPSEPSYRFDRIDLRTGELRTPVPAESRHARLASVSPSGRLAAILPAPNSDKIQLLEIFPTSSKLVRTIQPFHAGASFAPIRLTQYDDPYGFKQITLISDHHLLVLDLHSDVAVIDLTTLNVLYRIESASRAVLSPGYKHFALHNFEGIHLIESLTGKDLGRLPAQDMFSYLLAFSPDGNCLGAANYNEATVWNLSTGKQQVAWRKVPVSPHKPWTKFAFSKDNEHLIIQGKSIFSLKMGQHLGDVVSPSSSGSDPLYLFDYAGRTWFENNTSQGIVITGLEFPGK
jgi:hypothetical protein